MTLEAERERPAAVEKARPSLRDEQKNFTRARLLDSAAAVIAEHGFVDATIGQIVEHANASRATFYLHFRDKRDVLDALVLGTQPDIEAYYTRLDEVLATEDRAELRQWVGDAVKWFEEHAGTVLALEHTLLTDRATASTIMPDFASYMPVYTARWPEEQRLEASLRVWLAVGIIARVFVSWRHVGSMSDVGWDLMIDVLTGVLAATLAVDTVIASAT